MAGGNWQAAPAELDDAALVEVLVNIYKAHYQDAFADELLINHALPVEVRALRKIEGWSVCLLLTPWMLARLYIPDGDPGIPIPPDWGMREREGMSNTVIGPPLEFELLGSRQKAHINYHPELGHYLLLPLIQSLEKYATAKEVYEAWNQVIEIRDENIKKMNRRCKLQGEISRREFFCGRQANQSAI